MSHLVAYAWGSGGTLQPVEAVGGVAWACGLVWPGAVWLSMAWCGVALC